MHAVFSIALPVDHIRTAVRSSSRNKLSAMKRHKGAWPCENLIAGARSPREFATLANSPIPVTLSLKGAYRQNQASSPVKGTDNAGRPLPMQCSTAGDGISEPNRSAEIEPIATRLPFSAPRLSACYQVQIVAIQLQERSQALASPLSGCRQKLFRIGSAVGVHGCSPILLGRVSVHFVNTPKIISRDHMPGSLAVRYVNCNGENAEERYALESLSRPRRATDDDESERFYGNFQRAFGFVKQREHCRLVLSNKRLNVTGPHCAFQGGPGSLAGPFGGSD